MGKAHDIDELSIQSQATFLKWRAGVAVREAMWPRQKRTFQRHKKEILEVLGVDILKSMPEQCALVRELKCHGSYLIPREEGEPQGFVAGILQKVTG